MLTYQQEIDYQGMHPRARRALNDFARYPGYTGRLASQAALEELETRGLAKLARWTGGDSSQAKPVWELTRRGRCLARKVATAKGWRT